MGRLTTMRAIQAKRAAGGTRLALWAKLAQAYASLPAGPYEAAGPKKPKREHETRRNRVKKKYRT